jgi:hypothetical protein
MAWSRTVLIAAALVAALLCVASSSANHFVYGSNGCGKSEYKPEEIVLACGDGKVIFEIGEWTDWGEAEAVGVGVLKHPDLTAPGACQRTILACPWVESEGTASFYRPAACPSNDRRQFTRLRIDAPKDSDPELREVRRDFKCGEYSSPSAVRRLGATEAARFMRSALARRPALSFEAGYARKVKCNKRVSRSRVRCKMSWNFGDLEFSGKGLIWLTHSRGNTYWNYAYRIPQAQYLLPGDRRK